MIGNVMGARASGLALALDTDEAGLSRQNQRKRLASPHKPIKVSAARRAGAARW